MFIIEKPGLEKQELVAEITANYTSKLLGIKTNNVSIEFGKLGKEEYANVAHLDGVHLISVNENNGVTKIIESVSHELRHVWQAKNGWDFNYSLPYREQKHEIDAWEFMDDFTSKYKDTIYQEYLKRRPSITRKQEIYTMPLEYSYESDLPTVVGLYSDNNTNKKESTTMTKQFTIKQLNKAGLVASDAIRAIIAEENITNIDGLQALGAKLEQDNRGTARINFKGHETFAYLLADKVMKGQIEGFEMTAKVSDDAMVKSLVNFQTKELKAGKYLVDTNSFVVYLTDDAMKSVIKYAVTLTNRYNKNLNGVTNQVKLAGYEGTDAEKIVRYITAHHAEDMSNKNLTNIITKPIPKMIEEAVAKLFPIVEEVIEEVPAADESPVAEEIKEEKDEVAVEQKVITVEEHNAVLEQIKTYFTKMQDQYEKTIEQLSELNKTQADEIDKLVAEQTAGVDELRTELAKTKSQLQSVTSLRKADARRIEKLQNEMGRARLQLRDHKAREISEGNITELPEDEVSKTVHARIVTAGKIDDVAQSIHEKAPEKIANVADKTKDGIQWVADKTKGGVDLTARGTNFASEKMANAMTFVADKIAPSTETVVESILQIKNDEQVAVIGGVAYKLDGNGKLIF